MIVFLDILLDVVCTCYCVARHTCLVLIIVHCLRVLNVHFCKKSQQLAHITFCRYVSNPDIGRTFWDGLTHSNEQTSKMVTCKTSIVVYVLASWSWYLNYGIQRCRVGI